MFSIWVAALGLANCVLWGVAALAIVSTRSAYAFLGLAAFLVFAVWVVATSITMYRGRETVTALPDAEVSTATTSSASDYAIPRG